MARLLLIRHGQASFLADDYDKLSPLGLEQSRLLGQTFAARGLTFTRVLTGPLLRQRETTQAFQQAYAEANLPFPAPTIHPGFAEYPGEDVVQHGLTQLPAAQALQQASAAATTPAEKHAAYQRLFEHVVSAWSRGEVQHPALESWTGFQARVNTALTEVLANSASAERVAIFTSGGVIALILQRALALSDPLTLQASWMSRNASWSDFLYPSHHPEPHLTLSTFNAYDHLPTHLHTYR